jgi:predicted tellurium resistance membrane protein TerC
MLVGENAHLSNALILGSHVTAVPKGYLYFAISFSLFIEVLNMKASKRTSNTIDPNKSFHWKLFLFRIR